MALPDVPLTRAEEYLNNIATGEGKIPDVPLTRIDQYLDYIAKNGGGGSSGGGASEPLEEINTYTYTGSETSHTLIETDSDGNPFRLKRVVLCVTLATVSEAKKLYADLKYGGRSGTTLGQANVSFTTSSTGYKCFCFLTQDGGYWHYQQTVFGSANIAINENVIYSYVNKVEDCPYMDCIDLTVPQLPAGSTMKILGVRA